MAKDGNSSGAEKTSTVQLAALALIVIVFIAALVFLPGLQAPGPDKPAPDKNQSTETISVEAFQSAILTSQRVAVVMDVRKAPDQTSGSAILQCGVNLASSLARINKTVDSYAYDAGDLCYTSDGRNATVEACEQFRSADYALVVAYGPTDTRLYADRALIFTNENYGASCFIEFGTPEQEVETPKVDPNATANTALKTSVEIFGQCAVRDYCLNQTVEAEQQSCLRTSAVQLYGDPTCCFGLNATDMGSCLVSTAGLSHGVKDDYCQFLSGRDHDLCYYNYAVRWIHYPYCEGITGNASIKADCFVEMAKAGALPSQQVSVPAPSSDEAVPQEETQN